MGLLRVLPGQVLSVCNARVPKAYLSLCSSSMKMKAHKCSTFHSRSISHLSLRLLSLVLLLGTSEKSLEPSFPSPSFSYAKAAHRSIISPSLQGEGCQVSQSPFTLTISLPSPTHGPALQPLSCPGAPKARGSYTAFVVAHSWKRVHACEMADHTILGLLSACLQGWAKHNPSELRFAEPSPPDGDTKHPEVTDFPHTGL